MKKESKYEYEDIINRPRFISKKHPPMDQIKRAAQFAPFAALKGHEEEIKETARLTQEKIILGEDRKLMIDSECIKIKEQIKVQPLVEIVYFKKDLKKAGGRYISVQNKVKSLDEYYCMIKLIDGLCIPLEDIYELKICSPLIE